MGQPVDANGRSILHKGHGMTHTCAVPDVCKTPSPGGPIPIPYVNVAMDSNISDAADSVKIEGNPVANISAKISTSTGDEPGSAGGGIMSSKIKGTVTWKMGSLDVKAEGKSVVRFIDTCFHNGNSFNTSFIAQGGTGVAYADDFDGPCPICDKSSDEHKVLEKNDTEKSSARVCAKIVKELKEAFDAERPKTQKYATFWDDEHNPHWGGYMVGVMVCKQHEKLFAAMSSSVILDGFREIAESNGCTVVGGGGSSGGRLSQNDYVGANTSGIARSKIAAAVAAKMQGIKKQIAAKNPQYSAPGICAGAHLLAKSGHSPAQMTEMFFMPAGHWSRNYDWRIEGRQHSASTTRPQTTGPEFGPNVSEFSPWGNTVASCKTCQDLLALTMCPERVCKK